MNKRYGHQLPKGYVFRLPTEAEWEWAFLGDKNGDIRKLPQNRFSSGDQRFRTEFQELMKKQKVPPSMVFTTTGWLEFGYSAVYVGGRTEPTDSFGVCDMGVWGRNCMVLDSFDLEGIMERGEIRWRADSPLYFSYAAHETDPCHFAGKTANRALRRQHNGYGRWLGSLDMLSSAHLVVAPDIEAPLKKKELEPYAQEDFGGRLLSDAISHGGLSAREDEELNTPERFKRMISRENTMLLALNDTPKRVAIGFATAKGDAPWILLNLNVQCQITGLQLDAITGDCYNRSRHLRVWTSEDGKVWREVAAEDQKKRRFCFDLQRKNVTAKYIRVGREPGFMKEWFALDKILVYGKEIKGR